VNLKDLSTAIDQVLFADRNTSVNDIQMTYFTLGHILLFTSTIKVYSQESATLPPPCPILSDTLLPGTLAPSFSFNTLTGINISFPGTLELPFVAFIVDDELDPGGVIVATDTIEIDRFLNDEPPLKGSITFFSRRNESLMTMVLAIFQERLALLPSYKASMWLKHLFFSADTVEFLSISNSNLSLLAKSWQSPRLFITAPNPNPIFAPRVDGFYECYQWPPAQGTYPIIGPFNACIDDSIKNSPKGSLVLIVNITNENGTCNTSTASSWAQLNAPNALGAILSSPSPSIVGRNCDDTFVDDLFYPLVISDIDGIAFANKLINGPSFNVSLNYTCDDSYWLGIDSNGFLAVMGWRKYTETTSLRWMLDHFLYLEQVELQAVAASSGEVISLVPSNSILNNFQQNITFPSAAALRSVGSGALLDFKLRCNGIGDNDCGPWDRIISSYASCIQDGSNIPLPFSVEIARWITPFRRSTGRWLTSASVLIGLVGNASTTLDMPWTCSISVVSCCEQWRGSLDLLLPSSSTLPPPPFVVIPIVFPNQETHFGPTFNVNKTVLIETPSLFSKVTLTAIISGHGSDPPPPVSSGCEYAPTSHSFSIRVANSTNPILIVNSSDIAYSQFMLAGSMLGCANKVSLGVIANSHGDYRDGRDGWCPGQVVSPLIFDVTDAFTTGAGVFQISYNAISYWVDGTHPSENGCGGDIYYSGVLSFSQPLIAKKYDTEDKTMSPFLSTRNNVTSTNDIDDDEASNPSLPCIIVGGNICGGFSYNNVTTGGVLESLGTSSSCGRGPGFMAMSLNTPGIIYATTENEIPPPEIGSRGTSGISTIKASCYTGQGENSTFRLLSHTSTDASCHVAIHPSSKWVFSASYDQGTISVMQVLTDSTLGPANTLSVGSKAHAVNFDATGRFVFVPCLGEDAVAQLVFDQVTGSLEWNENARFASLPTGSGPRHMIFLSTNPLLVFVLCELTSILVPFSLDNITGVLMPTQTGPQFVSTIRTGLPIPQIQAAAEVLVSEDGRYIYVSNRASPIGTGDNSIAVIPLNEQGQLVGTVIQYATGDGDGILNFPRHAMLSSASGQPLLIVAGQNSNMLTVFTRDLTTGLLTQSSFIDSDPITQPIFIGELFV
jgi:6-phosphogluconolactonase (cycloisomerase 2 family)